REAVARRDAETILTGARREIAADAEGRLQGALDRYGAGARVLFLDIVDLHPPEQGIDSFRDVSSAREDKQARIEKARSYRNGTIPQARGEAAKVVKGAEDYRASLVSEAEGRAGAFNQQYEQYRRAPEVTRTRLLLETMEKALPAAEKYIVDADDRPPEFWLDGAAPPELR
ncbi:MAG: protease modulator HflK, partial [Candidatus Methylomirabilis sp.]|nr:protease modulator HflK [Deltaproteobacteria bacterium]